MKNNFMISIIIPIYNQANKIGECLESILLQTYKNNEVIVVNDGSTDDIKKVIEDYKLKFGDKLKFISKDNEGSNPTRNRGVEEATGNFLLFCDADIVLKPDMLEKMHNTLINNPEKSFVFSSFKYGLKTFKLFPYDIIRLKQMPYIHTTSLIRREHFPGFDNKIKRLQDWDLWLTMLEQEHAGIWLDEILFKVKTGGHISTWLPTIVYKLMPFLGKVKKYNESVRIIKEKHGI